MPFLFVIMFDLGKDEIVGYGIAAVDDRANDFILPCLITLQTCLLISEALT